MAIVNRDLDSSQQVMNWAQGVRNVGSSLGLGQGGTFMLGVVPCPMQLVGAGIASRGSSGTLGAQVSVERFVAGSGYTTIILGASMALWAFGTSGGQTFNVGAGVTYTLQTGDVLNLTFSGVATASADQACVTLALKALQDIKSSFGASV